MVQYIRRIGYSLAQSLGFNPRPSGMGGSELPKPVLVSIGVSNDDPTKIIRTYDIDLDETSIPDISDFGFSLKTGTGLVDVSGKLVTCTVTARYYWGDAGGTSSYTKGTNPIKSVAGGEADSDTDVAITNNIALDAALIALVAVVISFLIPWTVLASIVLFFSISSKYSRAVTLSELAST